jgi:AhpD family alkylhydroperoxidase
MPYLIFKCIQMELAMENFKFYTPENTTGHTKELLENVSKAYGFIPNLYAYMAEAPTAIEAYLALDALVTKTSFTPAQQQIALLAASVENECKFCIVAHHAIGKMKGANVNSLSEIATKNKVTEVKDKVLADFTQLIVKTRGKPSESKVHEFIEADFTKQQILEVILIVATKTLSNYINHFTNPEPNKELIAML